MFPAVTAPKSSESEPSTTKRSSSPAWRCSGSLAPASMRLSTACRFVAESAQRLLARTPGCRSCHARSLIEMIWDSGVVVALISGASAGRIGWRESRLLRLELQVLVRRREGIARDEPETGFVHAPADAVDESELVHRRHHHLLRDKLLDSLKHGRALDAIELARLLPEESVDVGVAAVGELTPGDCIGLEARGGVAERAADDLHEVPELLLGDALVEGCPLERAELGADSDALQVTDHRLGRVRRGHVAEVFPGVEAAGIAGLGEELLRAGGIEGVGRRLPEEIERARDDAVGDPREAAGPGLVDRAAIDGEIRGEPYPPIVPR